MALQVSSVRVGGGVATVSFQDGHRAVFAENIGGFSSPTSLERIWLERGKQTVAMFHSKHQYPLNRQPFGLTQLAPGYTVERTVSYWRTAYDYVATKFRDGKLIDAWLIVCLGHKDMEELKAGEWPAP